VRRASVGYEVPYDEYGKYSLLGCKAIVLLKLSDVSEERTVIIFRVK
jgi:hypothetical protein